MISPFQSSSLKYIFALRYSTSLRIVTNAVMAKLVIFLIQQVGKQIIIIHTHTTTPLAIYLYCKNTSYEENVQKKSCRHNTDMVNDFIICLFVKQWSTVEHRQ